MGKLIQLQDTSCCFLFWFLAHGLIFGPPWIVLAALLWPPGHRFSSWSCFRSASWPRFLVLAFRLPRHRPWTSSGPCGVAILRTEAARLLTGRCGAGCRSGMPGLFSLFRDMTARPKPVAENEKAEKLLLLLPSTSSGPLGVEAGPPAWPSSSLPKVGTCTKWSGVSSTRSMIACCHLARYMWKSREMKKKSKEDPFIR